MKKITLLFGIFIVAAFLIMGGILLSDPDPKTVLSYEDCVAQGYEADEYECRTPAGETFVANVEIPEMPPEMILSGHSEPIAECLKRTYGESYAASAHTSAEAGGMVSRCMEEVLNEQFPDGPPQEDAE